MQHFHLTKIYLFFLYLVYDPHGSKMVSESGIAMKKTINSR